jgi:hypothetical protein
VATQVPKGTEAKSVWGNERHAVLAHAVLRMGEPIFVWVKDAASYFNQFGYALEELWKSNLIVSARAGDIAADGGAFYLDKSCSCQRSA